MENEKEENTDISVAAKDFFTNVEVKIVWKEDDKIKIGRGKIMGEDANFIYLTGYRGKVMVSKADIVDIKQAVDTHDSKKGNP